jgi:chemotaxis protein CheX
MGAGPGQTREAKNRQERKSTMAAAPAAEREGPRFEQYLDRAVEEVFSKMMGVSCVPGGMGSDCVPQQGTISAVVGLAGAISGSLVLESGSEAAMRIAERLTGMEPHTVDALVRDAMGEVGNMIAGAWKGADPELASGCLLSTPTVVSGNNYQLFSQRSAIRVERSYAFEKMGLRITIFCEFAG